MASATLHSYVNSNIDPNLICCICRNPFNDPVTTQTCLHTFCQGCILQAISISAQCPIDRSHLLVEHLVQADPIVRHLVDELLIECPNWEEGCRYTCQRQLIEGHLKGDCGFVSVACNAKGCEQRDVANGCVHKHGANVSLDQPHQLLSSSTSLSKCTCESCDKNVTCSELNEHVMSCPQVIVSCEQSDNGCPWVGRRHLLDEHTTSCPYQSIRAFFALNSRRLSALSDENMILRRKVDVLEGTMRSMQWELQTVKAVLGPWYRPEGLISYLPSLPNGRADSDFVATTSFAFVDSSRAAVMPNAPYHLHPSLSAVSTPPGVPSSTPSSSSPSLADYFPPEEPQIHNASRTTGARIPPNLQYTLSAHHFSDHGNACSSAGRSSLVAPLNLSTTLEGSLTGLRESLVTLSAALESQGRRQELALTTEGLRVNEEVGSLKAVVHGLRMQVHSIMMDRNAQVTGRFPFSSGAADGGGGRRGWSGQATDENVGPDTVSPPFRLSSGPGEGTIGGSAGGWFPNLPPPPIPARSNNDPQHSTTSTTSITKL